MIYAGGDLAAKGFACRPLNVEHQVVDVSCRGCQEETGRLSVSNVRKLHDSNNNSIPVTEPKGSQKRGRSADHFTFFQPSSSRGGGNTLRGEKKRLLTNRHVSLPLSFVRGPQRLRVPVLYLARSLQ